MAVADRTGCDSVDLFVYGSLMVPQVMRSVCGHAGAGQPAVLRGYRRRLVSGETYPAVIADASEQVEGLLYRGLDACQCRALDLFEGEMYRRETLDVWLGVHRVSVQAYVLRPGYAYLLTERDWSLERFLAEDLMGFLSEYAGFRWLADRGSQGD